MNAVEKDHLVELPADQKALQEIRESGLGKAVPKLISGIPLPKLIRQSSPGNPIEQDIPKRVQMSPIWLLATSPRKG